MFRTSALLAVLALGQASTAAAEPMLSRGTHELALHVSPDFESAIGDMLQLHAGYGVFVADRWLARGTVGYLVMEDIAGNDNDYTVWEVELAGEYHFDLGGRWVPYAGASIGWRRSNFGGLRESAAVYGPRAGVKVFVADNAALVFDIAYRLASADVFVNDFEPDDADIAPLIGLRVLF